MCFFLVLYLVFCFVTLFGSLLAFLFSTPLATLNLVLCYSFIWSSLFVFLLGTLSLVLC